MTGAPPTEPRVPAGPTPPYTDSGATDDIGLKVLRGDLPSMRRGRRLFRLLPSSPRCKLCASPFAAPLGPVMRLVGKAPWPANPKYCSMCFADLTKHHSGAEIDCSLLFADVRGSTTLAEQLRPLEFRNTMDRFFATATEVLVAHDAVVDKFVGDEVIAIFIPVLTAGQHARSAVDAGRALLNATQDAKGAPWIPVGVGVNTGIAFVGAVGAGDKTDLTAMGDTVNVAARLASAAGPGEMLVTVATADAASLDVQGVERRSLELKGKTTTTDVFVLGAA
jgi:adenylate cyclase